MADRAASERAAARPPAAAGSLAVSDLEVSYDHRLALRAVTFTVQPGTLLAVTGPSGAGKSSLLWAVAGGIRPTAGTVTVGGLPVTSHEDATRLGVILMPQGNGLAASLTAEENITFALLGRGLPAEEAVRRASAALAQTGLAESASHLVEELSGGQQQRVAVARALATATPGSVVLADEPTSDVDPVNRERLISLLRNRARTGAVVVMTTHDQDAAAECDAELALDEGRMSWVRPVDRPAPASG